MKASFTCIFEIHGVSHAKKQQQILVQFFSKIPDAVKCISCRQPVAQELDVC